MGNDVAKMEKYTESGFGNELSYIASNMQGYSKSMKNAYCAIVGFSEILKDWSFFAVFGGHLNNQISNYSARHLLNAIIQSEEIEVFKHLHDHVSFVPIMLKSIIQGHFRLDREIRRICDIKGNVGTTAVSILTSQNYFYFSNVGNSRAVLSRNKQVCFSTVDHKPKNKKEERRIRADRGFVIDGKLDDELNTSRGLGFFNFKDQNRIPYLQKVLSEPEVTAIKRTELDEFIILATNNVYSSWENEELCDIVRYLMQISSNYEEICNSILDVSFKQNLRDNESLSIMLVVLPGAPKVSEEFRLKDQNINDGIRANIIDVISNSVEGIKSQLREFFSNEKREKICQSLKNSNESLVLPAGAAPFKCSIFEEVIGEISENFTKKLQKKKAGEKLQNDKEAIVKKRIKLEEENETLKSELNRLKMDLEKLRNQPQFNSNNSHATNVTVCQRYENSNSSCNKYTGYSGTIRMENTSMYNKFPRYRTNKFSNNSRPYPDHNKRYK